MGNGLRKEGRPEKRVEEEFFRPSEMDIALQGSDRVGKSALIVRFVLNYYYLVDKVKLDEKYRKQITLLADDQPLQFEIPDPREGESPLSAMMRREENIQDARGLFFVYSITSSASFHEIEPFIQRVEKMKDCPIEKMGVLIGNKADLEEHRQVPREKGEELAKRYGIPFFETSAKTGENVEEMFQALGSLVIYGEPIYQSCKNIKSAKR